MLEPFGFKCLFQNITLYKILKMNSFSVDYLPAVPDWAITFAGVKKREQNSTRVWKTFMIVYWYRVRVLHKQDYE